MAYSLRLLLLLTTVITSLFALPTIEYADLDLSTLLQQQAIPHKLSASSPLRRIRDSVIEAVWPRSHEHREKYTRSGESVLKNLRKKYGDDVVLRFTIDNGSEAQAFRDATDMLYLDVWESSGNWTDVRIRKDKLEPFLNLLPPSMRTSHKFLIHDLAMAVYDTYPSSTEPAAHPWRSNKISQQGLHDIFFNDYQPLSVVYPWLRLMTSLFPHLATLTSIGVSAEGREIPALRIGSRAKAVPNEPYHTVLITAGSHAREWISVSTATFLAYDLLLRYGTRSSPALTKFLDHYDVIIVPVLNPDGYEYTWTNDRLWRKTRQSTGIPFCAGIDLDRAFSFNWDGQGDVDNPCTESYAGTQALEATEAKALTEWARNLTDTENVVFASYVDLHSYSQKVLYPYSYSCRAQPTNIEDLEEAANVLAKYFRLTTGHFYEVQSACDSSVTMEDPTSNVKASKVAPAASGALGGSALDYFYAEHVKYAYQIKLRDTGSYGFLLPKGNIVPAGRETVEAILGLGRWLLGNRGIESKLIVDEPSEAHNDVTYSGNEGADLQAQPDVTESGVNDSEWERVYDPDFELRRRR